jgi:ketosteroid isomerase-like protein
MTAERTTDDREADEVLAVMRRYTDAAFHGDADGLRACFHPDAVMSGQLGEQLLMGSPEPFFTDIGGRPSMESTGAPYEPTVVAVDVLGRVASVRIDETGFFGAMSFANWFHLLKGDDGQWRIVSKAFMTREA